MRILSWIVRIVLFLVLFVFAYKNGHLVQINTFFNGVWEIPLSFVLLMTFAVGALLGFSATFGSAFRRKREISKLRKEVSRANS